MRISDWSSDVCSSDLLGLARIDDSARHHRRALCITPTDPAVLRSGLQLPPEAGWPVRAIRRLLVMAPGTARGYAILGARGVGFRQGFARALAVEPEHSRCLSLAAADRKSTRLNSSH